MRSDGIVALMKISRKSAILEFSTSNANASFEVQLECRNVILRSKGSSSSFLLLINSIMEFLLSRLKTLNSDFTYEVEIINTESNDYGEIKAKEMCKERDLYFDRFTYNNRSTICISTIEGPESSILI